VSQAGGTLGHGLCYNTGNRFQTENTTANMGYDIRTSSLFVPRGRWICLEWEFVGATGPNGSVRLYVDDQLQKDISAVGVVTQPMPPLRVFGLGQATFGPGTNLPARDVWYDDLIIDTVHVGCAK
jgi:hypothetical protein